MNSLPSDSRILFRVTKLKTKGACLISIVYYEEEQSAKLINEKIPYLTEDEKNYLDAKKRKVSLELNFGKLSSPE